MWRGSFRLNSQGPARKRAGDEGQKARRPRLAAPGWLAGPVRRDRRPPRLASGYTRHAEKLIRLYGRSAASASSLQFPSRAIDWGVFISTATGPRKPCRSAARPSNAFRPRRQRPDRRHPRPRAWQPMRWGLRARRRCPSAYSVGCGKARKSDVYQRAVRNGRDPTWMFSSDASRRRMVSAIGANCALAAVLRREYLATQSEALNPGVLAAYSASRARPSSSRPTRAYATASHGTGLVLQGCLGAPSQAIARPHRCHPHEGRPVLPTTTRGRPSCESGLVGLPPRYGLSLRGQDRRRSYCAPAPRGPVPGSD